MRSDLHEEVDLIAFARVFRLAQECPDQDFGLETMPDIFEEDLRAFHRSKVTPLPGLFDNEKGIVRACIVTIIRYAYPSWASQNHVEGQKIKSTLHTKGIGHAKLQRIITKFVVETLGEVKDQIWTAGTVYVIVLDPATRCGYETCKFAYNIIQDYQSMTTRSSSLFMSTSTRSKRHTLQCR